MKESITSLLTKWSIVAIEHGKIDGWGYGNEIHNSYGPECGEKLIIQDASPED